ncbi:MAG: response regulator [Cyanobacteria bacterium RYN_339]|nr:response regulator [Cyanobacteria bacterium RYN_339]
MKRVLLVEDSADNRGIIRELAEWMDFELIEATNGREGVDLALAERPDLILMDLSLPVLSGWEATRILKGSATTAAIPVIALTAHAMDGDEAKAREAGCDAYVAKPISIVPFQAMLKQYLGADGS